MPSRRQTSAFTLIESLIATAIIAVTATSVYYAFLRMNDFAASSRCDTAAKVVLERAVNLAMTTDWRTYTPPILASTDPGGAFQLFNVDTGENSVDGAVSLFTDPSNASVIVGTLSRSVVDYPAPAGKSLGDLRRLTFKLQYKLHKRADEPMTTLYAYTVRASDK